MQLNKTNITIAILVISLVLAVGYIALDKYQEKQQQEQLNAFQKGAQYGYERAIIQLFQQASTCQQVPINIGNQTINVIAVECRQIQKMGA